MVTARCSNHHRDPNRDRILATFNPCMYVCMYVCIENIRNFYRRQDDALDELPTYTRKREESRE